MVQREHGTPTGDLTPCQQRGWGGEPEASVSEQRPPREILTQEPVEGGEPKQIAYLQKLEAFQEGADPRPDIGWWEAARRGVRASTRVSQGPGCRPGAESILKRRLPGGWPTRPMPTAHNPQSGGDIKKMQKYKEAETHLPAPWCHLEAEERCRIPGFPACNQT